MIMSIGSNRITASQPDTLLTPSDLDLDRPPVVALHGANGDGHYITGIGGGFPNKVMAHAVCARGFSIGSPSQGNTFGQLVVSAPDTGIAALAIDFVRNQGRASDIKKGVLIGGSMGSFAMAMTIARDPSAYQCAVYINPAFGIQMIYDNDLLGVAPLIDAAHDIPIPPEFQVESYYAQLAQVPSLVMYSNNDPISFGPTLTEYPMLDVIENMGAEGYDMGALGHFTTWLTPDDTRLVYMLDFIESHTN